MIKKVIEARSLPEALLFEKRAEIVEVFEIKDKEKEQLPSAIGFHGNDTE